MCGIAGAFSRRDMMAIAARMSARVRHRGPDDDGLDALTDRDGRSAGVFAHRRLAIIDLSDAGHQPMWSASGHLGISFNGEIYNFRALRTDLEREGVRFRSQSDTEVILEGFALHGPAFARRLRGMFAFALWDRREGVGYLFRDPFGLKPLYYAEAGGALLFASEVRAVIDSGLVNRTLSVAGMRSYLAHGSVAEPMTIVEGITALRAGTFARVTLAGDGVRVSRPEPYIESPLVQPSELVRDATTAATRVRAVLRDSVAHHLVSDVPVALFLSGGIDSTAIVGLASEVSSARLDSFTVTFAERAYTETEQAQAAARRFGTRHHEIPLSGADLLAMLPAAFSAMDRPSMDGLNTYALSRAVRAQGLKVVLSGLGGDELFGGYPSFRRARVLTRLQSVPSFQHGSAMVAARLKGVRAEKLKLLLSEPDPALAAYSASRALFGIDQLNSLAQTTGDVSQALERAPSGLSLLQRVTWYETHGYMLNTLLRDSDVFSMACGLELRVPFVDVEVARVAASIDDSLKSKRGISKWLLVNAVQDLLPREVWDRPKQGFTLPFEQWLRHELYSEVSQAFMPQPLERVGLDPIAAGDVWRGFLDRRPGVSWSRPWALYTLIRWAHENDMVVSKPDDRPGTRRHTSPVRGWRSVTESENGAPVTRQRRTTPPELRPSNLHIHLWAPGIFGFKGGIQVYQSDLLKAFRSIQPTPELSVFIKNDPRNVQGQHEFPQVAFQFAGDEGPRLRTPRYLGQVLRGAAADRPNLIIVGHVNFAGAAYAMKRLFGIPYWIIAYGVEVWGVKNPVLVEAMRNADRVMAISHHTRDRLLREQKLHPARVSLLPPTFNDDAFHPRPKPFALLERYGLDADQPVILTVGRLAGAERYKGYDAVLDALPRIRKQFPTVHYLIVGEGDDRQRIEQRIARAGLEACVTLVGFVPDAELCDYYNLCDVFAMPSKREGFGIVYLEAAACGKAALGGNQDGAVDALEGGAFGALINPDDRDELATMLSRLLSKDYPSPLMYEPAKLRDAVIARYGPEQFRRTLEQHLRRFAEERLAAPVWPAR